jgi:hypothetical protein
MAAGLVAGSIRSFLYAAFRLCGIYQLIEGQRTTTMQIAVVRQNAIGMYAIFR